MIHYGGRIQDGGATQRRGLIVYLDSAPAEPLDLDSLLSAGFGYLSAAHAGFDSLGGLVPLEWILLSFMVAPLLLDSLLDLDSGT